MGNGGVELYAGLPEGNFNAEVDGRPVQGVEIDHHGFISLTLAADGSWQGTMIGKGSKQRAICSSSYLLPARPGLPGRFGVLISILVSIHP